MSAGAKLVTLAPPVPLAGPLLVQEWEALHERERTIQYGLVTFYEVGRAFQAIRDGALYRGTHKTFEAYCRDRWGFVASRARQMIAASDALAAVAGVTNVTPQNEGQVRPLMAFAPDVQREIWREAVETARENKPTGAHVQAVARRWHRAAEATGAWHALGVHQSSASADWYTPPAIVSAVVGVLGQIDLDPCAEDRDPKTVPARVHITKADDGLAADWFGRVYMNPPYGSAIPYWIAKLLDAYTSGAVRSAVALVPARTDTDWFWPLYNYPICFVHGRLNFSAHENSAPFPSALVYLGRDKEDFARHTRDMGRVVETPQYAAQFKRGDS